MVFDLIEAFVKEFDGSDHNAHGDDWGYGWIHYALIRLTRPENVLCVGSRFGFVPAVCGLAVKHNKKGSVHFVDLNLDKGKIGKAAYGGEGYWKQGFNPFTPYSLPVEIFIEDSVSLMERLPQKYSYIYLDGDHSYEGIKRDYEAAMKKVQRPCFIVLHDVNVPENHEGFNFGIQRFWEEIKEAKIKLDGFPGLGIIYV